MNGYEHLSAEGHRASAPLILAVDVTGAPRGWITWKDAVACKASGRVDRELGDFLFTFRGGHSRLTGERSILSVSSILALRGRNPHGWEPQSPALSNPLLFQRDRHLCCYCGRQKRPEQLTRDHILPLSRGGRDRWKNVVTACKPCNQKKGADTPERAGMLMYYVPYAPSLYEALILRNRRILADQMDFLISLLPAHSRLIEQSGPTPGLSAGASAESLGGPPSAPVSSSVKSGLSRASAGSRAGATA